MAISTSSAIEFFGTQDEVTVTTPSAVADGAFSVTADVSAWTNDDDAKYAHFVLNAAWTTAPTAGTTVGLYARVLNIVSTNDAPEVDANHQSIRIGYFVVDIVGSSTELYLVAPDCPLPNFQTSQQYEFYIKNNSGQSINSGWDLYVTPATLGPHG